MGETHRTAFAGKICCGHLLVNATKRKSDEVFIGTGLA